MASVSRDHVPHLIHGRHASQNGNLVDDVSVGSISVWRGDSVDKDNLIAVRKNTRAATVGVAN